MPVAFTKAKIAKIQKLADGGVPHAEIMRRLKITGNAVRKYAGHSKSGMAVASRKTKGKATLKGPIDLQPKEADYVVVVVSGSDPATALFKAAQQLALRNRGGYNSWQQKAES